MKKISFPLATGFFAALVLQTILFSNNALAQRETNGLLVLYDFAASTGDTVHDRSGVGKPIDLKIENPDQVVRGAGSLRIDGKTVIASHGNELKLYEAVKRSGEITIETWVQPSRADQDGPARIVSFSANTGERNFTLGQDRTRYDVRFRTNKTDANGLPSSVSPTGSLKIETTHVVYTRSRNGTARLYVDSKQVANHSVQGDLSNWRDTYRLAIGNELTGERPFLGTLYLVAIFDRAFSTKEIETNFAAGKKADVGNAVAVEANGQSQVMASNVPGGERVTKGLQVLYDFSLDRGKVIRDRSGIGKPVDLRIEDTNAVRRKPGQLETRGNTVIKSDQSASRVADAIKRARELTIETWIRPANLQQAGPARIVTFSKDSVNRNFTLGQEGDKFDVRLRTGSTSANGIPSIATKSRTIKRKLSHVVYTRSRSGMARVYVDGVEVTSGSVGGDFGSWDRDFRIALGNEINMSRQWLGTYHLVALFSRCLTAGEVQQNFRAGANGTSTVTRKHSIVQSANSRMFQHKIAPMLSKHCLECHDSASHQGGLNLARKIPAMGQSDSGQSIVPKNANESLVWQSVANDEMPHNRPLLSAEEKSLLKEWIDGGAEWSFDFVDPAIYTHEARTNQNWVQRLTVSEYIETVRASLGVDIEKEAIAILPPDMRADGFSNTAYNLNVDLQHVDAYAKLAEIIVGRMKPRQFATRFRSKLSLTDNDMRGLISEMGKWVLRGPLEDHEVVLYRGISTSVASAGGDLEDAIRYVIQGMLQSPRFIYRIEDQRGDGEQWQVGEYELASRISYIVWGAPPDAELLKAAENGDLYDSKLLLKQVDRMLSDQRAVKQSLEFVDQWLNLARMKNMRPDKTRFPEWEPDLAADMRLETLAFAEEVLWKQKRPVVELLNAQLTFLTPRLADHYGIPAKGDGMQRYDLKGISSRGGLMTQGSVLTVGGDDASMVTRGLLVMHELLRGVVKDPPACVDTTPVPSEPGISQRVIAEKRIQSESCGGCHSKFEPLAFGLEKFNGVGGYQVKDEYGNQLREDGQILIPGQSESTKYETSGQLMSLLAASERVKESLAWKVTQYALGRPLLAEDASAVADIHNRSQEAGGTYPALISAIVTSDLVLMTRTSTE